jgi:hypothetical protein
MRNSFRIVLLILGMFPLMSTLAFSLPGLVNYKGLMTDPSGGPVAGPVDVTFTLWDAVTGGSQLGAGFSDTDSVTPNVDGIYDTLIGDDGGPMIPGHGLQERLGLAECERRGRRTCRRGHV